MVTTVNKEETMLLRKGPWTEQEDVQLVRTVRLLGDRRWDFIAQVSGLNRTGKSCRLRWVNYLHPGLKHGRMSPQEERLIIDLHARWGNRWCRIARRLPGRTDNEIKNYWRTRMRKKAQERTKMRMTTSSPSSSSSSSLTTTTYQRPRLLDANPNTTGTMVVSGSCMISTQLDHQSTQQSAVDGYPMDQIWKEIEAPALLMGIDDGPKDNKAYGGAFFPCPLPSTAMWDYYKCPEEVFCWKMEDDEIRMLGSTD